MIKNVNRCSYWKGLEDSDIYAEYHDNEWGIPSHDDRYLYEMLLLESFQAGLSWVLILKKRENFRKAFDNFDPVKIKSYDAKKIEALLKDSGIIRNKRKILANINNAERFLEVQKEYGSFDQYIWSFTDGAIQYLQDDKIQTTDELSERISKDLKLRGFKFLGSVIVYSYLEAIGVMNHHTSDCFRYYKNKSEVK